MVVCSMAYSPPVGPFVLPGSGIRDSVPLVLPSPMPPCLYCSIEAGILLQASNSLLPFQITHSIVFRCYRRPSFWSWRRLYASSTTPTGLLAALLVALAVLTAIATAQPAAPAPAPAPGALSYCTIIKSQALTTLRRGLGYPFDQISDYSDLVLLQGICGAGLYLHPSLQPILDAATKTVRNGVSGCCSGVPPFRI